LVAHVDVGDAELGRLSVLAHLREDAARQRAAELLGGLGWHRPGHPCASSATMRNDSYHTPPPPSSSIHTTCERRAGAWPVATPISTRRPSTTRRRSRRRRARSQANCARV